MPSSGLLAIRPFRNLWLGQAISQVGDSFYYVSFMFMVMQITKSLPMVGFVGAMEALPFLIFSPYAGVLADRIDRRRIMLLSDILSMAILLLLAGYVAFDATPPAWTLLASAFMLSSVRSFFMPAKSAAIPALVPRNMLMQANSLSMATQTIVPALSLALSATIMGLLYAFSPQWFFLSMILINAASFLVSAWFISLLPRIVPDRDDVGEKHPLTDLREGLRYVRGHHVLVVLLVLSLFLNLMISPFFVVYMAANEAWFGGKPQTFAWFEFSFFAGMILGSILVAKSNIQRPGLGYIWGLVVVGGAVAAMAFSKGFALFVAWNVIAGLGLPFAQIPLATYLQTAVPDAFRGRVNSALTMIGMGTQPIGMSLGGFMIQKLGLVASFFVMGVGMGTVALAGLLDGPFRTMKIDPAEEPADEAGGLQALDPT